MRNWLLMLRDVVWTAVFAVVFAVLAIGTAIIFPNSLGLIVAFGLSAVAFAGLAQRV